MTTYLGGRRPGHGKALSADRVPVLGQEQAPTDVGSRAACRIGFTATPKRAIARWPGIDNIAPDAAPSPINARLCRNCHGFVVGLGKLALRPPAAKRRAIVRTDQSVNSRDPGRLVIACRYAAAGDSISRSSSSTIGVFRIPCGWLGGPR